MDLTPLLAPRSVAVVGASTRPGAYGNQALANLLAFDFPGPVWAVHPTAEAVLGVPCAPRLTDLPAVPDVVVVATPAATVPDLVAEAAKLGSRAAVVFAAGFAEVAEGAALQEELRDIAVAHDLPVCGPNGNGIVSVVHRAPLWGDTCRPGPPGPVALVSQSGNVAVNALNAGHGLRMHTVVSCGNQAVVTAADYLAGLAHADGVRSVALYLEDEGDGARLAEALAACAERDIGVAVLKAGASRQGAAAVAAHTGAVAGDDRILRALIEEAGGAWARNPHELLELAKAFAYGRRTPGRGVGILTCSGADAAVAADEAQRLGVPLAALGAETVAVLRSRLPATATPTNPLDYTAVLFGQPNPLAGLLATLAGDEAVGPLVAYFDEPLGMPPAMARDWDETLRGIVGGAERVDKPVLVAATLPELMPASTADRLADAGIAPIVGLSEAMIAAGALLAPPGDPARLRELAAGILRRDPGEWVAEHEAKRLLAAAGVPVPRGTVVGDENGAVGEAARLAVPVALKLSAPDLHHKTEERALLLGVVGENQVRQGVRALRALPGRADAALLVEETLAPGLEVLVAVRRDTAVPVLVIGLGGSWVEVVDDVAVVPLPVDVARVAAALSRLRVSGALLRPRSGVVLDVGALCELAVRAAEVAADADLVQLELNPVLVRPEGVVAVDALARRFVPR